MKSNPHNLKLLLITLLLILSVYVISSGAPMRIFADTMTNDNDSIDTENISIDSILHRMTTPIIHPINPIQIKTKKTYQIESDFAKSTLSFSVSQDIIDFGTISSTDPVIRNNKLTISNSVGSYQVIAYENHSLVATTSAIIPDVSCDNGSCSETTASEWANALTYGLGYHCDNIKGIPCTEDFIQQDYFRPFSNSKQNGVGESLMKSLSPAINQVAAITYKVNISGTQPDFPYQNTVSYIAIPGF